MDTSIETCTFLCDKPLQSPTWSEKKIILLQSVWKTQETIANFGCPNKQRPLRQFLFIL